MCGIAGIYNTNGTSVNKAVLKKMTDIISYRGPDGEGHWLSKDEKVGFGHRRLSIIDLTKNGAQPMSYINERYTITFNGEIYNYIELKKELEEKGYDFNTNTDTEVLLALYADKGIKCLELIDGMFAFAIWDEKEQALFCARDRFGEKPFHYHWDGKSFIFGSEIKELFVAGVPQNIDISKLQSFLNGSYIIKDDETFFKDIKSLKPAHYLLIKYFQVLGT
jgi:asparagine synthase (glutamine-hydrolysing)